MPDECQGCGILTRHLTPTDFGEMCDACFAGGAPIADDLRLDAELTQGPLTLDEAGAA